MIMHELKICGLQKTTLLDFPGRVAATVFTGGCNFRCPFCQNSEILDAQVPPGYPQAEVLAFLKKRSGVLEGVCITGGEPTLQPEALEAFHREVRSLGLLVKLDTNGGRPEVVKRLAGLGLLDYIAMDVKAGPERYALACGAAAGPGTDERFLAPIRESIAWLTSCGIPYEFRTTAVKGLHTAEDFAAIGPWIAGCPHYYIQNYAASDRVLAPEGFQEFTKDELLAFADLVRPYVEEVSLRGVDY